MSRLRSTTATGLVLLRADSAYFAHSVVVAAHRAGAKVSITVRMDSAVKRTLATIADTAWTTIQYTNAILDEGTGKWVSVAEFAEVPFTAFAGDGQPTLFDTHRFHAFFTTSDLDPVTADKTHRQHAVIEQINADLKDSALGHFPSGVFSANAAWLVLATITFNLSRAIGTLTGTDLGKARTATIRRKLIQIPARISTTARKVVLHLPKHWPWETGWTSLHAATCSPPRTASP